jgi:hypothetical protein
VPRYKLLTKNWMACTEYLVAPPLNLEPRLVCGDFDLVEQSKITAGRTSVPQIETVSREPLKYTVAPDICSVLAE